MFIVVTLIPVNDLCFNIVTGIHVTIRFIIMKEFSVRCHGTELILNFSHLRRGQTVGQ